FKSKKPYFCGYRGCKYGGSGREDVEQHLIENHKIPKKESKQYIKKNDAVMQELDTAFASLPITKRPVTSAKVYTCELCTRTFSTGSKLKLHKKRAHSGKRLTCSVEGCDRDYADRVGVLKHLCKFH